MKQLEWGLDKELDDDVVCAWGARTILVKGKVDVVPDRIDRINTGSEADMEEFIAWASATGFPWMLKTASDVKSDSMKRHTLNEGKFSISISANGSYGYLYATAQMKGTS